MPKKKNQESPEEQSKRFRQTVADLVDAGELSLADAETALDKMVRHNSQNGLRHNFPKN